MFAARRVLSRRSMSSSAQESFLKLSQDLSKTTGQDLTKVANSLIRAKDSFLKEMEDPTMRAVGFLTLAFFAVVHSKRRADKKHALEHAAHAAHAKEHAKEHAHAAPAAVAAPVAAETVIVAVVAPVDQAAVAAVQAVAPVAAAAAAPAAVETQQVKPILHQLGDVASRLTAIEKALGISN